MSQGPDRPPEEGKGRVPDRSNRKKNPVLEWVETLVAAVVVALLIRGFVVQVYLVDGQSMVPTLQDNERLLVNKFVYWFRDPAPGEVVVLKDPTQGRELIKRVVAVAGETVEVRDGVAYVDGEPLDEPYKNTMFTHYADTPPVKVPEGTIYVMGDNRGQSYDSRMIGPVDVDLVDGKAFFIFWPLNQFGTGPLEYPRTYAADSSSN